MILGIGIDMVECDRFLDWSGFKKSRIFTKKELDYADASQAHGERHLANFWAVREAFLKAIGTGFGDDIQFSDVSVIHDELGRPNVLLAGGAKAALKALSDDAKIHVSITDQGDYSSAIVITASGKVQDSSLRYYEGNNPPSQSMKPLLVNEYSNGLYIFAGIKVGVVF